MSDERENRLARASREAANNPNQLTVEECIALSERSINVETTDDAHLRNANSSLNDAMASLQAAGNITIVLPGSFAECVRLIKLSQYSIERLQRQLEREHL